MHSKYAFAASMSLLVSLEESSRIEEERKRHKLESFTPEERQDYELRKAQYKADVEFYNSELDRFNLAKASPRNSPCPCTSGLKTKNCCLKINSFLRRENYRLMTFQLL